MPISGMTGFGRAEGASGDWSWAVEARSVNGRNLEVRFRGPNGFDGLERLARDGGQARFHRGQVAITLTAKRTDQAGQVRINIDQAQRYLDAGAGWVASGRVSPPTLDGLLSLRGVIDAVETEDDSDETARIEAAMGATLCAALDGLLANRREEGASLLGVLSGLTDKIGTLVGACEAQAAQQPLVIRDRFARRLAELAPDLANLEDRILQEAAALAVKADVREELDRLGGHIAAARTLLAADGPSGRKLDFLTQEFMREANTLCSKSALPGLTALGLDLKATIEQFREQVQNVE